jgi:hypothetical protein
MDVDEAARCLAQKISGPRGAVSVSGWHKEPAYIKVWFDPRYIHLVTNLPTFFQGFKVVVEPRPKFEGNKNRIFA